MKLDNKLLHQFFIEKEIPYLYHANSVSNSITYIENQGLLSRGDVEKNGFFQTGQSSDELDKDVDVWFDIFLDTADLHGYFGRQNKYGPVLFKFDINFLLDDDLDIWITKDNPIYWNKDSPQEDYYFQSVDELNSVWNSYDRHKIMITLRKPNKPVLFDSLSQVIVDNPKVELDKHINLLEEATKTISKAALEQEHLKGKFSLRKCGYCFCQSNYLKEVPREILEKMFLLKT